MSEIPLISPLLDGMKLLEQFSDRGRTECFYLENSETGEQFVLKHISIPESDVKTQALILTGAVADEQAANEYYEGLAEDLRSELIRLQSFHEHGGVAAWTGYQIEPREGVGYDVYLLMPRKTSLCSHLQDKAMTHLQALNLGIDLCDALGTLREAGYTFQNLKPENVFVDSKGHFTIGDLGLMPLEDLQFSALPEHYLNSFSAPELSRLIPDPDKTSDIYALGMILFYIFNGNHLPFEDENTPAKKAVEKRQEVRTLPTPVYADYELAEIISVACSFDPVERYDTPAAFRQALTLYMQRNEVSDQLLVPPLNAEQDAPEAPQPEPEPKDAPEPPPELPPEKPAAEPELPEQPSGESEPAQPEPPTADPEPEDAPEQPEATASPESTEPPEGPEQPVSPEPPEPEAEQSPAAEAEAPEEPVPESIDELLASVNDVLNDEEPEPEAPDIEANEDAVKEAPKKKRIWIPILTALLVLGLLAAAFAYFYTNWYLVTMENVEVIERTADSITVAYQLSSPDPDLSWDCIDTYGNSHSGVPGEDQVVFRGLEPGTQYTIRFFPGKLHRLIGETTATAATAAMTQVVSMTAAQGPDKTTAEIALVVSGPEPEQWMLTYSSSGSDSGSLFFSGHSAEVVGLKLNETYTFELKAIDDVYLGGQTDCTLTMAPDVQVADFRVSAATENSLTVSWESLSDAPPSWTVQCTGSGYDQTQEVSQCTATFTGVRMKQPYTFLLSTPYMSAPVTITLPADALVITSMTAEALDAGSVRVDWTCTDPQPEQGWTVRYRVGASAASVSVTEGNTATITGLPANSEIAVTLEPAGSADAVGMSACTAQTPVASNFGSHKFDISESSLTLYARPSGESWTYDDLEDARDAFDPEANAAVVLQAPEEFTEYDTEETAITLVIRDETGGVAAYRTVSSTWNDIWRDRRYLTSIKLPEVPGNYQMELYFDSQFVTRQVFSISGDGPAVA